MHLQLYTSKKIIAIAAALAGLSASAQNISNPDFETYSSCPTAQTQIARATGWTRPTGGTSDYFNNCGFNISTTISPNSGGGYVGAFMEIRYPPSNLTNYKEYITNHLSTPLLAGVTYAFSFYVAHLFGPSPSNTPPTAITYADLPAAEQGYIGVAFSTAAPTTSNTENGTANFGATSIVNSFGTGRVLIPATNTGVYGAASRNAWVMVTMQYTATGGEEYMTVGQFRPGATALSDSLAAYYLFDNFTSALTPLPVTLQHFTASEQRGTALLTWSTAGEQNNKGFELQRSADGSSWKTIGFVPSRAPGGSSALPLSYDYTDAAPLPGMNFYRLAQTDRDGQQQYSTIQSLHFTHNASLSIYPNPAKSTLFINGTQGGNIIRLVNMYGQTVLSHIAGGDLTQQLDLSLVPVGVYILQVTHKDGSTSMRRVTKG